MEGTTMTVTAYAAQAPKGNLEKIQYQLPPIGKEQVDIKVAYCGICHTGLNIIDNEYGTGRNHLVPGHEIVGEVIRTGSDVKGVRVGDKVGVGWFSESCMHCAQGMDGKHHFCSKAEQTSVGRH